MMGKWYITRLLFAKVPMFGDSGRRFTRFVTARVGFAARAGTPDRIAILRHAFPPCQWLRLRDAVALALIALATLVAPPAALAADMNKVSAAARCPWR